MEVLVVAAALVTCLIGLVRLSVPKCPACRRRDGVVEPRAGPRRLYYCVRCPRAFWWPPPDDFEFEYSPEDRPCDTR